MRLYAPNEMTDQERAAKFIIFAIHQYWQNKILGQHGQAHKARIPRSKAALNKPDSECMVEHVMPQMEIVNRLMDMRPLTEEGVIELLTNCLRVMVVTCGEHARLNSHGLRSKMPIDWDDRDVFARYAAIGIELQITNASHQSSTPSAP